MKYEKIITSLLASILINCFIYAGGDWATVSGENTYTLEVAMSKNQFLRI